MKDYSEIIDKHAKEDSCMVCDAFERKGTK